MSDTTTDVRGPCAIAMPSIGYVEEWNPDVQRRVTARFIREIEALATLGFRELAFYRVRFGLFSSVLGVPMSLAMLLKREVMRLERGLQVSASFVLMYHSDPATVSVPLGLGVKLYTGFTDRTLLVSTNFPSCVVANQSSGVLKYSSKVSIADAWVAHQQHARALEAQGKQIHRSLGFGYYVQVSQQEELAFS